MSIETFLSEYGYLAVFIGVFIEGEAFVITAGFLAFAGLLAIEGVMLAAFAGSVTVYNLCFAAGRMGGHRLLQRFPRLRRRVAGVQVMLRRYHALFILGYRLMFGLRAITPFALGMSGVSHRRFFLIDLFPAAVWAVAFPLVGFALGETFESLFGGISRYRIGVAVAITLATVLAVLLLLKRVRRRLLLGRRRTGD